MTLLEIRTPKTTGITVGDTETDLSQQGKIYFCRRVLRHMGTARSKGQPSSLLIFLTRLTLPLGLDWCRSNLIWLKFCTDLGKGLRYTAWWAIFPAKGFSKNLDEEPRTIDNAGNRNGDTHFDRKDCFLTALKHCGIAY
jgi:hypothetical protein